MAVISGDRERLGNRSNCAVWFCYNLRLGLIAYNMASYIASRGREKWNFCHWWWSFSSISSGSPLCSGILQNIRWYCANQSCRHWSGKMILESFAHGFQKTRPLHFLRFMSWRFFNRWLWLENRVILLQILLSIGMVWPLLWGMLESVGFEESQI